MIDQTINANLNTCIKEVSNLGYETYYNICSGTKVMVPWGSADWFAIIAGCIILIAAAIGSIFFIRALTKS